MKTPGTRCSNASVTVGAIHGWKSGAVSVSVADGTLSRSITPGSGAGAGAGVCACRVAGAGVGRVGRRVPAGTGDGAMTRTSGSVVVSWARTKLGPISAIRLTEPVRHNRSPRLETPSLPYALYILVCPRP